MLFDAAPRSAGLASPVVPFGRPESSTRRGIGLGRSRSAAGSEAAGRSAKSPYDGDGALMRALIDGLSREEAPPQRPLGFTPSPASLKMISRIGQGVGVGTRGFEVFLWRERKSGVWMIAKGDLHAVSGDFDDFDMALHNHVDLRMGVNAMYSPFPSPGDLISSAGKDARFFVISVYGVVEWSPRIPFPGEPGRLLARDASDEEASAWVERLSGGSFWRRLAMNVLYPAFYSSVLRSVGVAAELRPWRRVTPEWLFQRIGPRA